MRRVFFAVGLGLSLAACGDPLAGLQKIDEVDLSQTDGSAAALPTEAEVAREGFLGTQAATGDLPAGVSQEIAAQSATTDAAQIAAPEAPVGAPLSASEIAAAEAEKPKGLIGLLRRAVPEGRSDKSDTQAAGVASAVAASQAQIADPAARAAGGIADSAQVQTAALAPPADIAAPAAAEPEPKRSRLFRRLAAKPDVDKARTGPDAMDVTYGTVLPFGVVARVCDAKGKSLGKRVEKSEAKGFYLHDSSQGAGGARTWYVTGFSDGCPRQLTAANVQLASASFYEQLHYGPGGENLAYGATDKAYDGIKRKVCGTRKGKPCGAKIGKMDKNTFFVSAYERFGNSSRWSELVIHKGTVLAAAIKPN